MGPVAAGRPGHRSGIQAQAGVDLQWMENFPGGSGLGSSLSLGCWSWLDEGLCWDGQACGLSSVIFCISKSNTMWEAGLGRGRLCHSFRQRGSLGLL